MQISAKTWGRREYGDKVIRSNAFRRIIPTPPNQADSSSSEALSPMVKYNSPIVLFDVVRSGTAQAGR
jgi:hypothetical protein